MRETTLDQASQEFGIERHYWDIWGTQHEASIAVQEAILSSLGAAATADRSLEQILEQRLWQQWSRPLPPTVVLSQTASPRELTLSVPSDSASKSVTLQFHFEDGTSHDRQVDLSNIAVSADAELRGRRLVRKQVPLSDPLPPGYHELAIQIEDLSSSTRLIVCPDRVYEPEWLQSGRAAGIAVSLYGVRSARNWGCGDFTDLKSLIDWAATDLGVSCIALNPLHHIPNRQPYNTSPYLPNSIFYKNPIYLDLEEIEEYRGSLSDAVRKRAETLRNSELVEYEQVARLKTKFLKLLFRCFLKNEYRRATPRAAEFQAYIDREGDLLHRFAVHAALDEAMHKRNPEVWNWRGWPEPYQDPESTATKDFASQHWRGALFHKYVQWQLELQLSAAQRYAEQCGLRIGLYHDLALATDRFGSDVWAHRPFYVNGCRVGSPPDGFSPQGQDWAFPPPDSERHYQDGYRLFAESIRKNACHGGALRIDHVMRFFHLFWIPDGMHAADGTYVQDRHEDLLRILALESVRGRFLVIGEDLGTVPDEIRESLQRFGVFSYRLFYFEQDKDRHFRLPQEYPADALVSATTHDLPTLAGFWIGRDIEARRGAGLLPDDDSYVKVWDERNNEKQKILNMLFELNLVPEWLPRSAAQIPEFSGELHNAIVGFLAMTPSQLFVLNQEDLLKEAEQQNLPGSTAEYPNWRRKMKYTVEELRQAQAPRGFAQMFRSWLERSGRLNYIK